MNRSAGADLVQKTAGAPDAFTERFWVREGLPLRSLLPDEKPEGEGTVISLSPGLSIEAVAGAGGAVLDAGRTIGGWCSYRCELAVPRRFAARAGKRLAGGAPAEEIVSGMLREAMQDLFSQASAQKEDAAKLRITLSRRLRDEAGKELLSLGWRLTSCRLEEILITRSEAQ